MLFCYFAVLILRSVTLCGIRALGIGQAWVLTFEDGGAYFLVENPCASRRNAGVRLMGYWDFDEAVRVFGFTGRRACLFGWSGSVGCGNVQMYVGLKSAVFGGF